MWNRTSYLFRRYQNSRYQVERHEQMIYKFEQISRPSKGIGWLASRILLEHHDDMVESFAICQPLAFDVWLKQLRCEYRDAKLND